MLPPCCWRFFRLHCPSIVFVPVFTGYFFYCFVAFTARMLNGKKETWQFCGGSSSTWERMACVRNGSRCLLGFLTLLLAMILSGCTELPTDVDALISPPKLTKQQQAIEQALSNALGGASYTLKYPHNGEYRSSFVLHSFDYGATNSVLAFYSPSKDKTTGTHVMILHQVQGKWKEVCDISGDGNEVDQVLFGNFDGVGADDLAIGWTSFTSTDMTLGVYSFHEGKYEKIYRDIYTKMAHVSMTGSNKDDLLLLKLDSSDKKASASLVSAVSGSLATVGQAPLDSTVTGYAGLYPTMEDGSPAVLIDSRKGTSAMVTEMVMWKDGKLTSPLYNASNNTASAETLRDVQVTCRDVDGDGNVDIPVPVELPGYETITYDESAEKIWKVQWMIWKNGALTPKLSSVINAEGYTFIFPDNWDNGTPNVTIKRENGDTDWAFYEWNPAAQQAGMRLFDILVYSSDAWNRLQNSGNTLQRITESDGMVFAYQANPSAASHPLFLDVAAVRQRLKVTDE